VKRRYVADPHDIETVKKIRLNEIELQDRNTVLRGIKNNVAPLMTTPVTFLINLCSVELHFRPVDVH
jgi:parafibromin